MSRFKVKNRATAQPQQLDVQFRSPLVRVGEPLMTRLLLVGGCEKDERKLAPKLKDYNSSIGWHWMNSNALATRGVFPSCDGVLVFTRACSHSLTKGVSDLARKAGVPVIPFDSWPRLEPALKNAGLAPVGLVPRTEMVTISVSTAAALAVPIKEIYVAPPAPQAAVAAPVPPLVTGGRLKVYPQDDEILLAAHTDWDALGKGMQKVVSAFLMAYDKDRHLGTVPPPAIFAKYKGNARGFVAFAVLATKDTNVTAATLGFLYTAITGKGLHHGSIMKMVAKVQDFCGAGYGLVRGRPGASGVPIPVPVAPVVAAPAPTPPVVVTPPPPAVGVRGVSDDDVLLAVHGYWDLLPKEQAAGLTYYLTSLDVDMDTVLGDTVREHLSHYDGNPRAFVALCLLATKGQNVRYTTLKNAHIAVLGKGLSTDAIPKMEAKVSGICGEGYGLRRSEAPAAVPPVKVETLVTPTPVVEVPVVDPVKVEAVKVVTIPDTARIRFERYVWGALDKGEKVTLSREGADYVVSHDDGFDMVFRAPRS